MTLSCYLPLDPVLFLPSQCLQLSVTFTCLISLARPLGPCWPAVVRVGILILFPVISGVLILPPLTMMQTDIDVGWKPQVPSGEGAAPAGRANEGRAFGSGKEPGRHPGSGLREQEDPARRDQVRQHTGEGPQSL